MNNAHVFSGRFTFRPLNFPTCPRHLRGCRLFCPRFISDFAEAPNQTKWMPPPATPCGQVRLRKKNLKSRNVLRIYIIRQVAACWCNLPNTSVSSWLRELGPSLAGLPFSWSCSYFVSSGSLDIHPTSPPRSKIAQTCAALQVGSSGLPCWHVAAP